MSFGYSCCGRLSSRSGKCSACHGDCNRRSDGLTRCGIQNERDVPMSKPSIPLDVAAAEEHLMRFLSVEGVTGQEANIAAAVSDALKKIGVPSQAIRFDDANTRI